MLDLLKETSKLGYKTIEALIEQNHRLGEALEGTAINRDAYQRLVKKLIYFSHTRSNIAYVSVMSQFMHNPKGIYLHVVYQILQYLKETPRNGILFKKWEKLALEAYTDLDYTGSVVDRIFTLGYCMYLGGNLVT